MTYSPSRVSELKVGDKVGAVNRSTYRRGGSRISQIKTGEVVEVKEKVVKVVWYDDHMEQLPRSITGKAASYNRSTGERWGSGQHVWSRGETLITDMKEIEAAKTELELQNRREAREESKKQRQVMQDTGLDRVKTPAIVEALYDFAEDVADYCIKELERVTAYMDNSKLEEKANRMVKAEYAYECVRRGFPYGESARDYGKAARSVSILNSMIRSAVEWEEQTQEGRRKMGSWVDVTIPEGELTAEDWVTYMLCGHARNVFHQVFSFRGRRGNSSLEEEIAMGEHLADIEIAKRFRVKAYGHAMPRL